MNKRKYLSKSMWITWERQTRNRSASRYIGAPLWEITYDQNSPFVRYIKSTFSTIKLFILRKPTYVFVQNPSIVLSLLGLTCSKVFGFKLIVDSHNSGINFEGRFKHLINFLNNLVIKYSKLIIVTNKDLAISVNARGGKSLILPDPLPILPEPQLSNTLGFERSEKKNKLIAFCITSWGKDEPVEALISAASMFTESIEFYFTGNYRKSDLEISMDSLPENVQFLGFVDEQVYFSLLVDCDFTVDLTTRKDCLVCGAYESVAAGKPILLSDTKPQREYFDKGAIFCETTPKGIQVGLGTMSMKLEQNKEAIKLLKTQILDREEDRRDRLISKIMKAHR